MPLIKVLIASAGV
ncbi:hypothetical protein CGLO_16386 [Colletotrichum gloeosporioides Cg-14]|uniref:Uncharacterized protein n=1 Tax=Colletotrichum gloeosporioides (strain Cg-14) TaxID=1237896 RepID=T0JW79_COLGC|nr:hypothetical protein CGLO_16386 [Colletotrichum gloeosporioides Cg-14]